MSEIETKIATIEQDVGYIKESIREIKDTNEKILYPLNEWKARHETEHTVFSKIICGIWGAIIGLVGAVGWIFSK